MWEHFFNWQSDQDWTWGPFVSLRPTPDKPIRPWLWVRLFWIFGGLGMITLGVGASIYFLLPMLFAVRHWRLAPAVQEGYSLVSAMLADPLTRAILVGLLFSLPPLFFLFCSPYHWAWNRRAARQIANKPAVDTSQGVWPPPPQATK